MSKIKKTSNKKTTGNCRNDFNNFCIEALEPRLLMAADLPTALDDQLDAMSVETVVSSFTTDNTQLQTDVDFLGGNLKTLSSLLQDSNSTLQDTLSSKLDAALGTLQASGSFADLSAMADALDADSVSLGDGWTATLDASASGNALDLTFDISKSVTGATLDIEGAEFSLSALTVGFTATLSLDLSTTTVDGVTDYTFSVPDAVLTAYAETEIQNAAGGLSYQGLSLNEVALTETEPDISLEIKAQNTSLSADLSVDLEFALSSTESIVTFPTDSYLTVKGNASDLEISVPTLKLANTTFLNNVSIANLKDVEVPFLRAENLSVSFLKLFGGDSESTTNPVENSISTGAAQVYAAVQQALSQMTNPSLQALKDQVTSIESAANTALNGTGYSMTLEAVVNDSATPQTLTYSIVLKKAIDSGYDFLLGDGLSLINLDGLVNLEMAFGMTVSLDAENQLQVASDGFSFQNIGVNANIGMEDTELNLGLLKATAEPGSELNFSFALSETNDDKLETESTASFMGGVTLYGPDGSSMGTYDFAEGNFKYEDGIWTMPGEWSAFEDVGAGTVLSQLNTFLQYVDTTAKVLASESLEMGLTNGSVAQLLDFAESIKKALYVKENGEYSATSLVQLDDATQQLMANFYNWTELQTMLTALVKDAGLVGSPLISFVTDEDSVIPTGVSLTLSFETGFTGDAYLSLAAATSLSAISTSGTVTVSALGTLSFTMIVDLSESSQELSENTTLAELNNYDTLTEEGASITNDQFAITATEAVAGTLSSAAQFLVTVNETATTSTTSITLNGGSNNTTLTDLATDLSTALGSDYEVLSLNSALQVISGSEFSFSQGTGAYSQLGFSGSTLQTVFSATLTTLDVGGESLTFGFQYYLKGDVDKEDPQTSSFSLNIPTGTYSSLEDLLTAINGEFSKIQEINGFGTSTLAGVYGIYAMGYQQTNGYRILFACDPARQKLENVNDGVLTSVSPSATTSWTFGSKQYMLQSITQYSEGRLGSDFELGLTVNGTNYTLTLSASKTLNNKSLSDLVQDLNDVINTDTSLSGLLAFSLSGKSLVLKALGAGTSLEIISANDGAEQAGFVDGSTGNTKDLRVVAGTQTYEFEAGTITETMTLDELLDILNGQHNGAIHFSMEGDHLEVKVSASGERVDSVSSINGSTLAELLGLSNLNAERTGVALVSGDVAARFSFTDVELGADVSLTVNNVAFTATWGALGVTGTVNGSLSASMDLVFVDENESITLSNLRNIDIEEDLTPTVTLGTDNTLTCALSTTIGGSPFPVGSVVLTLGKNATTSALELSAAVTTNSLPQITDLTMANLFSMLTNLQEKIGNITDRLDQTIPVVNRNLSSLITISENLTSIIAKLRAQNLTTVQGFVEKLNQALASIFSNAYCTASVVNGVLNLDFTLTQGFSSRDRFSFKSGDNNLSGAAELYTQGNATLSLGLALTKDSLTLTKAIALNVNFKVSGDNLKFNLSLGVAGLNAISQLIEVGNGSFIAFGGTATLTLGAANMDFYSADPANPDLLNLDYSVTAKGKLSLTVAGISLGDILLGTWDTAKNKVDISGSNSLNLQNFAVSLRTEISETNFASDSLVLDLSAIVDKLSNFTSLDFFDKLKLVADGLDAFLETVGDGLNTALAENMSKVPVVGEALAEGIDVFSTLQNDVVDRLREFVYSASDLDAQSVAAYLNTLFGNYLDDGFDTTVWGSDWSTLEEQVSGDVQYGYDLTNQVAEWAFTLGGDYNLGTNVDLDLGMPGLNLSSEGGVKLSLGWSLNFGFGISKTDGFYLILPDGKELSLNVSADLAATLTGSLGFLGLKMETTTESHVASADVNVYLELGEDDLTGAAIPAISPTLSFDALVNINAGVTLGIITDLGDDSPSFPNLTADFELTWAWNKQSAGYSQGLNTLGFSGIEMDMGTFISKVLGPIVTKIQAVTEPMQPIINFLTTPFPVLKDLGFSITPLQLAEQYAGEYFDPGMITALQDLISLADKITSFTNRLSSSGDSLTIDLGAYYFVGGTKPLTDDESALLDKFLNGTSSLDSSAIANYANKLSTNTKTSTDFTNKLGSDFSDLSSDDSNWSFFWDNPTDIFKLFFGENIDLVTYDMPALSFSFNWSEFFRIYGPLGVRVGVDFGITIDLKFGYDTQGIADFIKSDYSNYGCLVNGFYVADCNTAGQDVNELTLYGGLFAAAELNAGVNAGVGGGVNIEVGFDLYDPNHDGKVRLKEMYQTVLDTGALSLFDMNGKITAELFAYIDLWLYTKKWNITDPITIATFSYTWDRKAVLAESSGNDVVVNVGSNAESRLNGNTTDGNEEILINSSGNSITDISFNGKSGSDSSNVSVKDGGKLVVNAGEGDDKIILTGTANFDIEIHGGVGNDVIDLSGLTLGAGYVAMIYGGAGNDTIIGSQGFNIIFGDDGTCRITRSDDKKSIASYVATGTAVAGVAGNDTIFGNSGNDVIFGGAGDDLIANYGTDSTTDNDILIGDAGRVTFSANKTIIDKTQSGAAGNDTIIGSTGGDTIYGGLGNDKIDGGAGDDTIYGEKGNDLIFGGSGDDIISGGEGMDIILGDGLASSSLDLSAIFGTDAFSTEFKTFWGTSLSIAPITISASVSYTDYSKNDDSKKNYSIYNKPLKASSEDFSAAGAVYGSDTISGDSGSDVILGDGGAFAGVADIISGGVDNDLIDGDGGDDTLSGDTGNDVVYGGAGSDIISGGAGDDKLYGDAGLQGFAGLTSGTVVFSKDNMEDRETTYGTNYGLLDTLYAEQTSSETEMGDDTIDVGSGMDFADGQGGNDTVQVTFSGGSTSSIANVFDSGVVANSSADKLLIRGTVENDSILIRAATNGLGLVALVPSDDEENSKQNIERINLWQGGVDKVSVDAAGGDDTIAIDGTVADTTVNGASGNDTIQIGQVYKSARGSNDSTEITADDAFNTVETTEGFLSDGVSENTSLFVQGSSGDDIINIYHNVGSLNLQGNSGDDNFSIRGFTTVNGDTVTNGAMSLDGGAGKDSMLLRGSEGEDVFVITKEGISSNVVSVEVSGVESTTLDGAAGDDTFNIQGNNDYDTTVINGGLGNDTVNNGGSLDSLVLRSANLKGQTSQVNHAVYVAEDSDTAYNDADIASANFTVVDTSTEPAIIFLDVEGSRVVYPTLNLTEGAMDSFFVSVVGLTSGEMTVTLSVPSLSESDAARNERGLALSLTGDGMNLEQSLVITFQANQLVQTADGYYKIQVYVYALEDTRLDGSILSTITAKGAIVGSTTPLKNQVEPIKVVVSDVENSTIESGFIACTDSFQVSSVSGSSFTLNQENPQSLKVYLSDRASVLTTSDYTISGDTLTLSETFYNTLMTALGTGSVSLRAHYTTNTLILNGENYVELAYEQVNLSTFVMKLNNQVILTETQLEAYKVNPLTVSGSVNTNYYYKLDGGQLLFYSVSLHKLVGLKGSLSLEGGFDLDGINNNLSSVTSIGSKDSSSTVPEIAITQTDTTVVENSAFSTTYTVSLSSSVAEGKKVYVLVDPAETPYLYDANGDLLRAEQLSVSVEGSTSCDYWTDSNGKEFLRLIFDSANTSFTIRVSALQDNYAEDTSIVEISAGINTISDIDGAVYAYGAGATGESTLADPMLLEHKQMLSTGNPASPETNLYASLLTMLSVSGKTMVVSGSVLDTLAPSLIGATSFTEEGQLQGRTITFVLGTSESVLYRIESASLENGNWTLTLNSVVSEAFSDVSTVEFVLGAKRDSLFVNETESVDRFFVNNQNNVNDATSSLSSLGDAVSWSGASDYENAMGTDAQALRFASSELVSNGLSFSDFEYAELNLGTGSDTVEMAASVARSDAFQTFTVLNSGAGADTVAVTKYQSMNGSELGNGTLGDGESSESETGDEQFVYTITSFSLETAVTNMDLAGWYIEITDASGAMERREIKSGAIANGVLSSVVLSRDFSMAVDSSTTFRVVGQVVSYGNIGTNAIETIDTDLSEDAEKWVTSVTLTPVWSNLASSISAGDVLVLTDSNGVETRTIIASVNGNVVALSHTLDTLNYATYRVETKLSDDQLVINAQAGNDTITATGDNITREGLIVFGGNGADTITVDNSAYVFGDRGQVIYTDDDGKVVTRLGSTGTDVNAEDTSDYATESERGTGTIQSVPAYLQTDGVRREATYFQTMNNTENSTTGAQSDAITINGDNNIVFGGNDGDSIQINGSTNVALGDGGRLDFDLVTDANDAAQYGDEVKRYLHYVRTVDDPQGGADTINTGDGDNILFGGAVNDTLTSRSGDDIIVGDGGELELDESRNPVRVSNEGRLVGGADYISAGTGLNTVFGGVDDDTIITGVNMQSTSTDLREAFSNDTDVVLGDNGYRTFQGTATDVETTGILSFNFQGNASTGLDAAASAGAEGVAVSHWNNVAGSIAGTYGNDDDEIVTLASGERISGVTLSYGGLENNRLTSTDSTIQLQAYTQTLNETGADATLMGSGLLTTAPNNQSNNRLGVEVDGLKQHFSTYDVIVYLDAPDNCSDLDGTSVRKVTIYQNGEVYDYFYLNDASGSKYNGSYIQATAKSAAAALIPTSGTTAYANYVVFTGLTADNFRVEITDGVTDEAMNGLDLPSIAGIQVKGTYYLQDKVASSADALGGKDSISTGGGDDIVIGGIGNDVMATFGDVRYGESDADIVFGDNASITLMDRNGDGIEEVTHAISTGYAETSADLSFNDTIVTGNGNDTVVGGDGTDRILTQSQDELAADILADSGDLGVTIAPLALVEEVLTSLQSWDTEDLTVFSINLTSRNADNDSVVRGRAGVVADENWNNICLYNGRFYVYGSDYNSTTAPMNLTYTEDGDETSTTSVGVSILAYDTTNYNTSNYNNSSITEEYHDELDSDSENSKLFNSYLQAQSQQRIQLTLTNLNAVVGNNSYDVYVYLDVENSSTDTYNYIYQIFSASNGSYAGETYYLNDWTGNNFNGEFREVTASSANTNVSNGITPSVEMIGNYVVFHNVTGSTFNVFLQNYHTGSGQWPKNMPAITGVQVVVNNTQNANGTKKALPTNGDYDKDVVLGDNGKVNFALDIPYAVDEAATDYQNKVITADSMVASFTGSTLAADSNDFITTGRNQDTIIGGNGSDAIDSGAGDDVVAGDNANIEMADYNAIGVRMPSTEIILDQLTINTSNNEAYIGMGNTTASTFTTKWNAGGVPGVTLTASDLSGNDIIDAGLDNDFVIGGAGKDVLIANEGQTDVLISESQDTVIDSESYATKDAYLADLTAVLAKLDANDQGILNSFVNNDFDPYLLPTLGSILTETYEEPEGPTGDIVSGTYTLTAYQSQSITLAAGETVELVSSANFGGNQWWTPNVVLQVNASSATTLGWSWMDNGATQSATTTASGYYVVNIADAPNEDGLYVIRLTAATAGTINVAIAQG